MLVGLGLMLLMIFRPQGIFGDNGRWRSVPDADAPTAPRADGDRRLAGRWLRRARACAKPDPILVVDGVRRASAASTAVDVDHLEVQRGCITALIGPNGAGKTTLFNLLTGFDKPDAGTWTFDGQRLAPASPAHQVARPRAWCARSSSPRRWPGCR